MKTFNLNFAENEAQYLLDVLAEQPFKNSHVIISNMNKQIQEQLTENKEVKLEPKK